MSINKIIKHKGLFNAPLYYYQETSSTIDIALALIAQNKETVDPPALAPSCGIVCGTSIIADSQTQGKGRRGNKWESPPNKGLYLTVILPKESLKKAHITLSQPSLFTIGIANAVIKTIHQTLDTHTIEQHAVRIKWPNDILIDNKKIGGVLASNIQKYYVLSVGVNVGNTSLSWSSNVPPHALAPTFLNNYGIHLSPIEFYSVLRKNIEKEFLFPVETLLNFANNNLWMKEQELTYVGADHHEKVKVLYIQKDGALIVRDKHEQQKTIYSGYIRLNSVS